MIYFETSALGYTPHLNSWMQRFITNEMHKNRFVSLIHKFLELLIDFKHQSLHDIIPCSDINVVTSICQLDQTLAVPENGVDPSDEIHYDSIIEQWFWFCLMWSIGSTLDDDGRREVDLWVREVESPFPSKDTVYDYFVDCQKHAMVNWEDKLPTDWKRPEDLPFNKILVPTIGTLRNSFILEVLLKGHLNALFVGYSGAGKTVFIENTFAQLPDNMSSITVNLSSSTSSNKLQEMIENAFEIRAKSTFLPIGGKHLALFIDDFNMPARDIFGS
jgi:dynein heavy chain